MQPYEEENMEDMKNKMLARIEELKQEMANIREGWKQESRQRTPSLGQETQASIQTLEDQMAQVAKCGNEEEDTHDNTFEPTRGSEYENVEEKESVEGKENNMTSENNCIIEDVDNEVNFFNPCDFNDNDSFDFPDDDDEKCVDTCENNSFNSMENNSIESCVDNFSNSYDSNSSNPCENNSFVSLDDNDGLESFTFGDESLSNELVNDLHEILDDDEMNVDASLLELNDVEFVTYHDNCLEDALYIHDLIGKDRSEGVEKENVKEEVEDKKKTSNESVREEVKEKVRNDEKDYPKSGTTWLKALVFSVVNRAKYNDGIMQHPLLTSNPHDLVPHLDVYATENPTNPSACRIPLVSHPLSLPILSSSTHPHLLFFMSDCLRVSRSQGRFGFSLALHKQAHPQTHFPHFSPRGFPPILARGLAFRPLLGSRRCLLQSQCPIPRQSVVPEEEENEGAVQKIIDLCSFEKLRNLEVNKDGLQHVTMSEEIVIRHNTYSRRGEVGDWKTHLTQEMKEVLDQITEEKFKELGLKL
nr:flavonol 3-sulfotransferase-like [Ipomoea batatas]